MSQIISESLSLFVRRPLCRLSFFFLRFIQLSHFCIPGVEVVGGRPRNPDCKRSLVRFHPAHSNKNPRNEGFRGPIVGVNATGESGLSIRVIAIEVANKKFEKCCR